MKVTKHRHKKGQRTEHTVGDWCAVQCAHAWPSKRRSPKKGAKNLRSNVLCCWTRQCPLCPHHATPHTRQAAAARGGVPVARAGADGATCIASTTFPFNRATHGLLSIAQENEASFCARPPHSTAQPQPQNTDTKPCRARLDSGCLLLPPSWRKFPWPLCLPLPLRPPPLLPARPLLPACTLVM